MHRSISNNFTTHTRYLFQAQEMDDEISGSGNSIDFGNRMYDPRLGRMRSLDAFASKYPSISPYAFVYNNPISNIEIAGDSVLFYSASGTFLGYSHDNQRYKDKNLLVIIDDKQVDNFKDQYHKKRMLPNLTLEQKEAHVAGLEAMGKVYEVKDLKTGHQLKSNLVKLDKLENKNKALVSEKKSIENKISIEERDIEIFQKGSSLGGDPRHGDRIARAILVELSKEKIRELKEKLAPVDKKIEQNKNEIIKLEQTVEKQVVN